MYFSLEQNRKIFLALTMAHASFLPKKVSLHSYGANIGISNPLVHSKHAHFSWSIQCCLISSFCVESCGHAESCRVSGLTKFSSFLAVVLGWFLHDINPIAGCWWSAVTHTFHNHSCIMVKEMQWLSSVELTMLWKERSLLIKLVI